MAVKGPVIPDDNDVAVAAPSVPLRGGDQVLADRTVGDVVCTTTGVHRGGMFAPATVDADSGDVVPARPLLHTSMPYVQVCHSLASSDSAAQRGGGFHSRTSAQTSDY